MYAGNLIEGNFAGTVSRGEPMIIDSFAGGGGASTGIEMALGRSPDIAINHNAAALALHAANHPDTLHLSENVYKIDPLDHVRGRHIGLAWFSPDCKHFSKAKGGKPVERNIRDLAHIIPFWVGRIQDSGGKVDVVIMENVEEFSTWGPLIETDRGLMPDPARKGETFQKWCKRLRSLGGKIQKRELRACDYGAPTIRKRLFVVVRFDGGKITWPAPTHGAPDDRDVIAGRKLPWRTAAEIIDWSIPCPSIFDTAGVILQKFGLRAIRPLADNTLARVARGMKRYVLDAQRPFLVTLTHGARCEDIAEPVRTLTCAHRGEKAVVAPSVIRFNSGATGQDCREPMATVTANGHIKRPGGAAPLGVIAPHLAAYYGEGDGGKDRAAQIGEPVRTITTENRHAVIAPHLMTMRNSGKPFNGADEPAHTITAGGAGLTLVAPSLMSMKGSDRRDSGAGAPHPTVCAGGGHSAIVAPVLGYAQQGGATRSVEEPAHTITASGKDQNQVMVAFLAQHNNDSRRIGGVNPGREADEPLSTITSSGAQQGLVVPFLSAYYGVDQDTPADEPMHTATTRPRFAQVEAAISAPPFTPEMEGRARLVADFMRTYGFWDEREFVTLDIGGVTFIVVDIGMRMLKPRELYNAQGFPAHYRIERGADGTVFPLSVQVSCVGNSVSPPVAAALVAANCGHLARVREAA